MKLLIQYQHLRSVRFYIRFQRLDSQLLGINPKLCMFHLYSWYNMGWLVSVIFTV